MTLSMTSMDLARDEEPVPATPLRVVHLFAPAPIGGAERVVHDLATGLVEGGGVRVTVVGIVDRGASPLALQELSRAGVEVIRIETEGRSYWSERKRVTEILGELHPDVVHTHGYRTDILHSGVGRRLGAATVATVHGYTGGGRRMKLYEWLDRRALRRVDAVVPVSNALAHDLARMGVPESRIRVIRNAWRPRVGFLEPSDARAVLGVPLEGFHVGWIGRLSPEKGPDLIPAVAAALDGLPLTISVIGDGPERVATEKEAVRLGVGDRIRFHGPLPDAARYMRGFDALLLTSRTEGTPIVVLEGMHAGVPVVAPEVGGIPEMLGEDGGLLVEPGRPDLLAAGLRDLYAHPDARASLAMNAGERLLDEFDPALWIERYRRLYDSVVAARAL